MDIVKTLKYIARTGILHMHRDFIYVPPVGGYVNNDEAEWDATIWTDPDPVLSKPDWATLVSSEDAAIEWYNDGRYVIEQFPSTLAVISELQTAQTKTVTTVTRSMDTVFRPSTSRDTIAVYTGQVVSTSSLSGGQVGSVVLEIADDETFTTGVTEVCRITNGQTGTLVVGLNLIQTLAAPLVGVIPKNKYARLRSLDTTGSPTQSYIVGQETQF